MINPFPKSSHAEIREALDELDHEIVFKEDLEHISVVIDVVLSAFARGADLPLKCEVSSKTVMKSLRSFGLSDDAIVFHETLEEIASLTLYDDTVECEQKLEEAESVRSDLYTAFEDFLDQLFAESEAT